jgi:antitoxin CptB
MDEHYATLGENELRQFEMLLNLPDNDLWDMIMQKQQVKDQSLQPVLRLLQGV